MGRRRLNIRVITQLLGGVAAWFAIIALCIIFIGAGRTHYNSLVVDRLYINIVDSTTNGNLITTPMIRRILSNEKIKTEGELLADLPLTRIERIISKNGFVERVEAYGNYHGEVSIDIYQRNAAARILLNGYNCYISKEGFIFNAPPTTALYTPVITGDYRPLFPANYVGSIDDYTEAEIDKLELEIERIEREKYPVYERERENKENMRDVRRRYTNRSLFEDEADFDRRVVALREDNRKRRELYAYRQRVIESELKAIQRRQDRLRDQQKKLQKSCDDIHNLITFVGMVEEDRFWRSEVVQIMLTEGVEDQIRISMAVRSANFHIIFGTLLSREDYYTRTESVESSASTLKAILPSTTTSKRVREEQARRERRRQEQLLGKLIDDKFKRLEEFYHEALPRVGWDRYREINIEFDNQVVCKK